MDKNRKEYIEAWIQKSKNDYKNAEIILSADSDEKPFDTVCFHCQQTVEKILKAYLVFKEEKFPNSHNLSDLVELCIKYDSSFLKIQYEAESLTGFAVESRYPDDYYEIIESDAVSAFDTAKKLMNMISSKIEF